MDFKKLILITGLMVTSYFMVVQWSKDYPSTPAQGQQSSSQIAETSLDADGVAVPSLDSAGDSAVTGEQTEATQAKAELIKVTTDVLDITIDTRQGDVVEVALPGYPVALEQPDEAFLMLQKGNRNFIARSGVNNAEGKPFNAVYQAEQTSYNLNADDTLDVVLTWSNGDIQIDKTFHFKRGQFAIDVTHKITNLSGEAQKVNSYGELLRDRSNDPGSTGGMFVMKSFLGFATSSQEDAYQKIDFGDLDEEKHQEVTTAGWLAFLQHYFLTAWVPDAQHTNTYIGQPDPANPGMYSFKYLTPSKTLQAGESFEYSASLYSGPKKLDQLEALDENLDLAVDFGWLWAISKPLFYLLDWFYGIFGNWGWAIIGLTLVVKAALYWPSAKAYRSMAKMRRLMPKMTEIREKYKDDRQKQSMEMMKLYQKEGANPVGGCLPMLLQMPIFLALYYMFFEIVELRQAPFIFWIEDLSVMDPYFVLPILMGLFQFLQMRLGTLPQDPMQRKIMMFMPVGFTFLFMWFASGLVLYYVVNSALSVLQQWYVNRSIEKEFGPMPKA